MYSVKIQNSSLNEKQGGGQHQKADWKKYVMRVGWELCVTQGQRGNSRYQKKKHNVACGRDEGNIKFRWTGKGVVGKHSMPQSIILKNGWARKECALRKYEYEYFIMLSLCMVSKSSMRQGLQLTQTLDREGQLLPQQNDTLSKKRQLSAMLCKVACIVLLLSKIHVVARRAISLPA